MKDNIWIRFTVFLRFVAGQVCLFEFLFRTHICDPTTSTESALVCHVFYRCRLYLRDQFECILLRTDFFQLVRITDLSRADFRSLNTDHQCINCASLTVFFPCVILHILSDIMSNDFPPSISPSVSPSLSRD